MLTTDYTTAAVGATVTLDGSGSSDVDGDPLTYQWTLISLPVGSTATLVNPTTVNSTFSADQAGAYVALSGPDSYPKINAENDDLFRLLKKEKIFLPAETKHLLRQLRKELKVYWADAIPKLVESWQRFGWY